MPVQEARSEETPYGRVDLRYPASEVAAKHGASAAKTTEDPDEAYADWPGEYVPVRLPWPPEGGSEARVL